MDDRPGTGPASLLAVDGRPQFELSPYLYMQFMEPLGTTDGSVEAAWDFMQDAWRPDVIEVTRELAPALIRWGGCLSSYYRWPEGVGPRDQRRPMYNLLWGGIESNQVGTHEFVTFCRQAGADPLLAVNFESDGRQRWAHPPKGGVRSAGPEEAAGWVDYCNNPANAARQAHGVDAPYGVRLWQIGNETSYDPDGYDCETAARRTLAFAQAMRQADPDIALIGWGDSGWARRMLEIAGQELSYLAFHNMFRAGSDHEDSPLRGTEYRKDPARTWEHLMNAYQEPQAKIQWMREQVAGYDVPLAITECHFSLPGRNRCEVLSSWAAGVANARILNVHERNGDLIRIATLADFCGTRWQVNAIMIPTPRGQSYMMPVARVMSVYRHHAGKHAVRVTAAPEGLDVTASRTGERVFVHVVNTRRTSPVAARLQVAGTTIRSGRVFQIAADPEFEVMQGCSDVLSPVEAALPADGQWTFPPASVSAVELDIGSPDE
jgi:alpha-N-arabinofuranosidase